ncbi:MAG: antitoxin VapB family protein [Candidatus Hydrothermarchaeales archaeon]
MTKTISLSDDAYRILKNMKLKDESFSSTIKRLAKKRGRLTEILDLYSELTDVAEYEEFIDRTRKKIDEEIREGLP